MIGGHIPFTKTSVEIAAASGCPIQVFLTSPRSYYYEGQGNRKLASIKKFPGHVAVHSPYPVYPWSEIDTVQDNTKQDIIASTNLLSLIPDTTKKFYLVHAPRSAVPEPHLVGMVREFFPPTLPPNVTILFENPPTSYFCDPDHLKQMLISDKFKLCIDTAHVWAGGYDISSKTGASSYFSNFDPRQIAQLHLNDNKLQRNAQRDEHEECGKGQIWSHDKTGLGWIIRFATHHTIPMILERSAKGIPAYMDEITDLTTNYSLFSGAYSSASPSASS